MCRCCQTCQSPCLWQGSRLQPTAGLGAVVDNVEEPPDAKHRVKVIAADEGVIAGTADQRVRSVPAIKRIGGPTADNGVAEACADNVLDIDKRVRVAKAIQRRTGRNPEYGIGRSRLTRTPLMPNRPVPDAAEIPKSLL